MFPPGKEKSKDKVGIFELCNPHLRSEDTLSDQLTSAFNKHHQSSGSGPVLLSYFTQRTESAQGQQERGIAEETSKIILEERF